MKTFYKVLRVLAIIAAIIGIIYVVAAYGDKIVAWCRRTLGRIFNKRTRFFDIEEQIEVAEDLDDEPVAELA
jgi:hypothetical protein